MPLVDQAVHTVDQATLPWHPLGQTGHAVTLFELGGEGVLRTYHRTMKRFVCSLMILLLAIIAEARPNIILIMADDLGAEAVSAYGSDTYQTPNVDALVRSGMRKVKPTNTQPVSCSRGTKE